MGVEFYMTRQEVADIFGVTEATVGNWAERGLLQRASISNKTKKGMITSSSVRKLKEQFENVGECEMEIRKYRHDLVQKKEDISNALKEARAQYELVKNTGTILKLIQGAYAKFSKGQVSTRDMRVVSESLLGASFDELASEYKISKERVRQIVSESPEVFENAPSLHALLEENKALKERIKLLETQASVMKAVSQEALSILSANVIETSLSNRVKKCLVNADIITVRDIVLKDRLSLISLKNFGITCIEELESYLSSFGLRLGMTDADIANM